MFAKYLACASLCCALTLFSLTGAGCGLPSRECTSPWERLLGSPGGSDGKTLFLQVIRRAGIQDAFKKALAHGPDGVPVSRRDWKIETVQSVPGANGLVYVRVRPERIPGVDDADALWFYPKWFWFFFDRSGRLLGWSSEFSEQWLVCDVTGDGTKELLLSTNSPDGLRSPYAPGRRAYYTLYQFTLAGTARTRLGFSAPHGLIYGFALVHLANRTTPVVMTYEAGNPLNDLDNSSSQETQGREDRNYTVMRSFKNGVPRVVLVVKDEVEALTDAGGMTVLQPRGDKKDYRILYDCAANSFSLEWQEKGSDPVLFSAVVSE